MEAPTTILHIAYFTGELRAGLIPLLRTLPFGLQRLEESLLNYYYIDPSLEQQANSLTKERTET